MYSECCSRQTGDTGWMVVVLILNKIFLAAGCGGWKPALFVSLCIYMNADFFFNLALLCFGV